MPGQSIRPSQFITTYGPGSILEGPDGPRIIYSLERSRIFNPQSGRRASDFDITDDRVSTALLQGARVVALPTNAQLGLPDSQEIYETGSFPEWSLCERHRVLYRATYGVNRGCPQCPTDAPYRIWAKSRQDAIRFVRACPLGHLDDVDWVGIIPHQPPNHPPPTFLQWAGPGGGLRDIEIECPTCSQAINLGQAYGRNWPCSGRNPESGRPATVPSGHGGMPAKIMQRGAANLRVTDLVTALVISPVPPPLHNLLGHSAIKAALATRLAFAGPITSKVHVMQAVDIVVSQGLVTAARRAEIDQFVEADILIAVPIILAGGTAVSQADLLDDEFQQLRHAASNGAPATLPATPGRPPAFEVDHADVRSFPGPNGTPLRITPVSRLQVMMVQTGYRRIPGDNRPLPQQVSTAYDDGHNRWYPGVLLYGEGVFIDVDPASHEPVRTGPIADAWRHAWNSAQLAPAAVGDAFALPQPHVRASGGTQCPID